MEVKELTKQTERITDLKAEIFESTLTLRWKWQGDSDIVYIFKERASKNIEDIEIDEDCVKLYTKDEYREFNGYVEKIRDINEYKFIVFPAKEEETGTVLIKQLDGDNQIAVCTGKPEIIYEILEHKKLFSKIKRVQLIVFVDMPISKDTLCYVKKKGAYPESENDGLKFQFPADFHVGKNEMQPFEIGKDEYIKVFLNDVKKSGSKYILKRR
ncbi:hypothetical protein [Clostridium hydrogenum]|uniref:hypothetical protein n=1 Tax=Clostridium hydrogenum TaxID=2855764 RepID=UPI001F39C967|nr:hypothetical protein [Clostridium hydrogenum]